MGNTACTTCCDEIEELKKEEQTPQIPTVVHQKKTIKPPYLSKQLRNTLDQ